MLNVVNHLQFIIEPQKRDFVDLILILGIFVPTNSIYMLRRLILLFKFLMKVLGLIIAVLFLIFILKYITCPVFTFQSSTPFTGDRIYNPYQYSDPSLWHKGNFQVQSYAWGGATAGRGNSNDDIYRVYKELGYDIIGTSDYQRINKHLEGEPGYIPVYEHGYNIPKTHQVLIGSKRVLWKDYPFFQTIHNKQNIIRKLRPDNELIFLAHPKLRNGYSLEDMGLLANYDGIEVLNNFRTSTEHWDAALSSGNYVTILSNDDAHDVSNPDEVGHHCTLINSPDLSRENLIQSLRSGNAIGVKIWRPIGESLEDKMIRTRVLPVLRQAKLYGDTLRLATDSLIAEVRFIGQNGEIREISRNPFTAEYIFKPDDTYIRAEIAFKNRITFYLNPLCRTEGSQPVKMPLPKINIYKTWILRIVGFATLVFVLINIIWLRRRYKRKNPA